jgi:hypothetical protein
VIVLATFINAVEQQLRLGRSKGEVKQAARRVHAVGHDLHLSTFEVQHSSSLCASFLIIHRAVVAAAHVHSVYAAGVPIVD